MERRIKPKRGRRAIKLKEPDFLHPVLKHKPVRYKEEFNATVFYLCLLGANEVQIAQVLGVSVSTMTYWKETKPEFLKAVRRGKLEADGEVAHSMYRNALGYSHPDTVILTNRIEVLDDKGKVIERRTEPLIVDTIKYYPPNVTAGKKWLESRHPVVWGNKLEIAGQIKHNHEIDLSQYNMDELKLLVKLGVMGGGGNKIEDVDIIPINKTDGDE